MNPQREVCVGGANSSTTKFAPLPRLIPRRVREGTACCGDRTRPNFIGEVVVSVILIVLLLLFLNPFDIFMPSMAQMALVVCLVLVFGVFVAFVWREEVRDEREVVHRLASGRVGYLLGASILSLGIIVQSFTYTVDPWLVGAFVVMVLGKVIALAYHRFHY
ncbi:MAG: hypothetical protein NUV54_01085 [Candidatus Taylorbacteria bacterium]|nr:hypothetical protein [Candidatus Taylorbacteria bacterium]